MSKNDSIENQISKLFTPKVRGSINGYKDGGGYLTSENCFYIRHFYGPMSAGKKNGTFPILYKHLAVYCEKHGYVKEGKLNVDEFKDNVLGPFIATKATEAQLKSNPPPFAPPTYKESLDLGIITKDSALEDLYNKHYDPNAPPPSAGGKVGLGLKEETNSDNDSDNDIKNEGKVKPEVKDEDDMLDPILPTLSPDETNKRVIKTKAMISKARIHNSKNQKIAHEVLKADVDKGGNKGIHAMDAMDKFVNNQRIGRNNKIVLNKALDGTSTSTEKAFGMEASRRDKAIDQIVSRSYFDRIYDKKTKDLNYRSNAEKIDSVYKKYQW
jgi:hypothetical protein